VTNGHGLDPTALQELRDRVRREVDDGLAPAAQFALARDGQLLAFESFGTASDTTRFSLFSCTKAWIAATVWQLIGEGLLGPDTRVVELLPSFGAAGSSADAVGRRRCRPAPGGLRVDGGALTLDAELHPAQPVALATLADSDRAVLVERGDARPPHQAAFLGPTRPRVALVRRGVQSVGVGSDSSCRCVSRQARTSSARHRRMPSPNW